MNRLLNPLRRLLAPIPPDLHIHLIPLTGDSWEMRDAMRWTPELTEEEDR